MRHLLFLVAIFISFSGMSQVWCPPGATWHYRVAASTPYQNGVYELKYTNTITVNNIACKQIIGQYVGVNYSNAAPTFTGSNYPIIQTYENNSVVYRYNSFSQGFDTIVNFNATIGDKWRLIEFEKYSPQPCPFPVPVVTVIDTSHIAINGFSLKRIVVNRGGYNDTIIERLSCITSFLFPHYSCVIDGFSFGRFICYSDSTFSLYKRSGFETCQFIRASIEENSLEKAGIKYFPSPVSGKFRINFDRPADTRQVNFMDMLGNDISVAQSTVDENSLEFDLSEFSPGIYFAIISTSKGNYSFKVVKE